MLVAEHEGRKDDRTERVSGRHLDNRLVHVARPDAMVRPGDIVTARVTHAAPYHLIADEVVGIRRTAAGDAWERRAAAPRSAVSLQLGAPAIRQDS